MKIHISTCLASGAPPGAGGKKLMEHKFGTLFKFHLSHSCIIIRNQILGYKADKPHLCLVLIWGIRVVLDKSIASVAGAEQGVRGS